MAAVRLGHRIWSHLLLVIPGYLGSAMCLMLCKVGAVLNYDHIVALVSHWVSEAKMSSYFWLRGCLHALCA